MLRIILIALLAAVGYFAAGAAILAALRALGTPGRLGIDGEEELALAALWPAYMAIVLPIYGAAALARRCTGNGKHSKK